MSRIADILVTLERIAPSRYALDFDHIGLQVGDSQQEVTRVLVSLDRSLAAAEFAAQSGCQLLLCHHPLIWEPLDSVNSDTLVGKTLGLLMRNSIAFIAAHTNWDCALGGINDTLAKSLGLVDVQATGSAATTKRLKLAVFTPATSSKAVIHAASEAGAGVIGLYRRCAFSVRGTGTFVGGEGANPTVGSPGREETVEEERIEMLLPASKKSDVERAVRQAHPYEEPAVDFFMLDDAREQPITRLGKLSEPMDLGQFVDYVDHKLDTKSLAWGRPNTLVESVAICGGAGDDEWQAAQAAGAQVLVTGEVRQHNALEAAESGFALIEAGHYATEQPGCLELSKTLERHLPEVEWRVFEPQPGYAGRPIR